MGDKFWIENPAVLLSSLDVFPNSDMSEEERLNAITRLIIVISVILLVMGYKEWLIFLIIGIVFVVIIYFNNRNNLIEPYKKLEVSVNEPVREPEFFLVYGPKRNLFEANEMFLERQRNLKNIINKHQRKQKEVVENVTYF